MSTKIADRLGETLFSRNRRALLAIFFGHPDEEFYLRQVVRASGGGLGAVQRELRELTGAGILTRSARHKQVYFKADPQCPVIEELKGLVIKTAGLADVLRTSLAGLADRISLAFVYGSFARGRQTRPSDVDLLVVGGVGFADVVAALADAQAKLGREVNPTVYPPAEFRAKLVSRHHFLQTILKREKIFLVGDERELARLAEKRVADRASNERAGNRRPAARG